MMPAPLSGQPLAVPEVNPVTSTANKIQRATKQNTVLPSRRHNLSPNLGRVAHNLGIVDPKLLVKTQPNQIGITRAVHMNPDTNGTTFVNDDGSRVLILSLKSPDASGLRVHFENFDLPPGNEVYVYGLSDDSSVSGPYTGKGIWGDGEFWSGVVEGDTVVVEYYAPADGGTMEISGIGHLEYNNAELAAPNVLTCELDASCYTDSVKNSVARIIFTDDGDQRQYVCTGTLLTDRDGTQIPYFLTANHCISSQSEARSIVAYWFYQTTACNSRVLVNNWTTTQGANLLATSATDDYALLNGPPAPGGAVFAAWSSDLIGVNTSVFAFHHPGGAAPPAVDSHLRRAAGFVGGTFSSCQDSGLTNGYGVTWTSGLAEPGSSGSGLWYVGQGGVHRLIGVLSCGPATPSCSNRSNLYSKFSNFFSKIQPFLFPQNVLTVQSGNPNSGILIAVTPADDAGLTDNATPFTRKYSPKASVTLTAPASTSTGASFLKWQRDGVDYVTNNSVTVSMNTPHTMTAVYTTAVRTLTVASSNPVSGVNVTVSPNDNNGAANGATQFTRAYNHNASVSLTAPSIVNGNVFEKWRRDGADLTTNASTTVTMDADHTMTAVYGGPPIQVTVQTNPAGRSITVDNTLYTAPKTFSWGSGSSHTVGTTSPQGGATGVQYVFGSWSDGGAIAHTIAPTTNTTFTANFATQYQLTMLAGIGGGVSPDSGWHNSGDVVPISATANNGFTFNAWTGTGSGSYTGPNSSSAVTMNGPVTELAQFTQNPTRIIALSGNLNFSPVLVGSSAQQTLTIRNNGNSDLTVFQISYPDAFTGNWSGGVIPAGGKQDVTITFTPTEIFAYFDLINIDSDATEGINSAEFKGNGVPALANLLQPANGAPISLPQTFTWSLTDNTVPVRVFISNSTDPTEIRVSTEVFEGAGSLTITSERWANFVADIGPSPVYYWSVGPADYAAYPGGLIYADWSPFTVLPQASSPVITPGGGTFRKTVTVTMRDSTPGAVIHYTTNGTTPTASSPIYTPARRVGRRTIRGTLIKLNSTAKVKAIAVAPGFSESPITEANFNIVRRRR